MTGELERSLQAALSEFEIIDCHEHLPPEQTRVDADVDVFTLFSHYTRGDLWNAGMSRQDYDSLFDTAIPLDRRWAIFAPYWEQIRCGSYSKAALIAAQRFYGFDDINEQTYQPLSEAIRNASTPGIYERVLKDACNIRTCLTQCGSTDTGSPLLTPVMPLFDCLKREDLDRLGADARIESLGDYVEAMRRYAAKVRAEGAVGLKMFSYPWREPDLEAAAGAFRQIRDGDTLPGPANPLRDYIVDETIRFATDEDMVICVHAGYWGDFRQLDPLHIIPLLQRHPKTRFDVYHLGYPWVRETLMLGKGFPNVWLNFCWTHVISQRFAVAALDEAIDLMPMNKLLGFGGDYSQPVEKVYGHLVMAREDVAEVLARRIAAGQMTEAQALTMAGKWFRDNPKELYRLEL